MKRTGASQPSPRLVEVEASLGFAGIQAIGLASAAEAGWARVDEKLSDPLLRRLWTAVSVRQEALAGAAIDGRLVDAEQLCRALRDPSLAKTPFKLAIDALSATEYAVAFDPMEVGIEEWLEVVFRRARLRTADFEGVDPRKIGFTPEQLERVAGIRGQISASFPSPSRLGVFGMAAPARSILTAVAAIGELNNAAIEPGRREWSQMVLGRTIDEKGRLPGGVETLGSWAPGPGKQAGRLLVAWLLRRAIGAKRVLPLFSASFRDQSAAVNRALLGDGWTILWLQRMAAAAEVAVRRAERIQALHSRWLKLVGSRRADSVVPSVLESLFALPFVTTTALRGDPQAPHMGLQTAQDVLNLLVKCGILQDAKSAISPRVFEASGVLLIP